jgi:hypothetical protein
MSGILRDSLWEASKVSLLVTGIGATSLCYASFDYKEIQ